MDVDRTLRVQAGLISRGQALRCALSSSGIRRRVASGQWNAVHPGVYLAAGHPRSDETRVRAAVLWAADEWGGGAVADGVTAAWWHGLWPKPPRIVEITVPRSRGPRRRRGIRVRHRDLDDVDLTVRRNLPVTSETLTALEAAVLLGPQGPQVLDRALQTCVSLDWVRAAHRRNLGRRGSPAAAELIAAASDRTASIAERLLVRLLRTAGIPGWTCGYGAEGYLIDVAFPALRVAVEVDGWAWHSSPDRVVHDRRRQNDLVAAGWLVLRFGWAELRHRPDDVVARIQAAIGP